MPRAHTWLTDIRSYLATLANFPRDIKLFFGYALFSNIGIGAFALLFNLYLVQLGYREDFIGVFNGLSTVALAVGALALGRLLNRFGSWWCLTYGTAAFVIASVILAFMTQRSPLLAFGFVQGAFTAFVFVPLMPFVIDHARPEARSTVAAMALSLTSVSVTIGSVASGWVPRVLGPLLALEVPGADAFRLGLLVSLALTGCSLAPMLLMGKARSSQVHQTAKHLLVTSEERRMHEARRHSIVFVATGGLLSLGAGAVVPFYNVFLASIGLGASTIGVVYALASLLGALLGLLAPVVTRELGSLNAVLVIRLFPVPFYLALTVLDAIPLAVVAHVVRTISISLAWPIDSTMVAEILPAKSRANAFSYRSAAWNLGFALASFIAGPVIVAHGYAPVFLAFVLFSVLSMVLFALNFRGHPATQRRAATVAEID
jgi:MFS family permease